MRVWIDQDLCTGDGLCADVAPDIFVLLDDGLAYVKDDGRPLHKPGGADAMALVPPDRESVAIEAADECPGECIFLEP